MPLPAHALTFHGGCNCGAIRLQVAVPPIEERPLHPHATRDDPVSLPFVCIDHCNDCRRASGAWIPVAICTPIVMVTCSLVLRSQASLSPDPSQRKGAPSEERTPWKPASDVFVHGEIPNNSFLSFYDSSVGRRRWFCGRCGTHTAYIAAPWPEMLDIFLGIVDRKDLETGALAPERHLWWDCGIDWVQKLVTQGGSLPKHPSFKPKDVVEET